MISLDRSTEGALRRIGKNDRAAAIVPLRTYAVRDPRHSDVSPCAFERTEPAPEAMQIPATHPTPPQFSTQTMKIVLHGYDSDLQIFLICASAVRPEPVTIRLDPQVLSYFKRLSDESGIPYQSLIDYVLKDYAALGLKPSANWGKARRLPTRRVPAALGREPALVRRGR